ncbi:preprotein translocase subunit SecG [Caulobacter mirabilis]|uniref:Protein-export membrane protein SecG n=1 Tax=Caulobacter mirabilis TaxID=69666 RepID=A0A2D2AYD5_9CAUL|nr:preprotein translocase subunit SecG [Caulobacter mirabilis]ATQ43014.1 preprotein translocase subunit SecG [Caulobacter mirabilis]
MLMHILLVIHIIVCVLLIGFVLLQQSEGGALGMGGGPSGFMTARGAGNFMTRTTWILFGVFLVLSVILTILVGHERSKTSVVGRGGVIEQKLDPNALKPPVQPQAPGAAGAPATGGLTAPTPQVNQPALGTLLEEAAKPAQPAQPAQQPAPKGQ